MRKNISNIKKAIKYLNNHECVAIPTETVYGLAGNAYSNKATSKIYKLKKRPKKNRFNYTNDLWHFTGWKKNKIKNFSRCWKNFQNKL